MEGAKASCISLMVGAMRMCPLTLRAHPSLWIRSYQDGVHDSPTSEGVCVLHSLLITQVKARDPCFFLPSSLWESQWLKGLVSPHIFIPVPLTFLPFNEKNGNYFMGLGPPHNPDIPHKPKNSQCHRDGSALDWVCPSALCPSVCSLPVSQHTQASWLAPCTGLSPWASSQHCVHLKSWHHHSCYFL